VKLSPQEKLLLIESEAEVNNVFSRDGNFTCYPTKIYNLSEKITVVLQREVMILNKSQTLFSANVQPLGLYQGKRQFKLIKLHVHLVFVKVISKTPVDLTPRCRTLGERTITT
jgi:hypothetical protein